MFVPHEPPTDAARTQVLVVLEHEVKNSQVPWPKGHALPSLLGWAQLLVTRSQVRPCRQFTPPVHEAPSIAEPAGGLMVQTVLTQP